MFDVRVHGFCGVELFKLEFDVREKSLVRVSVVSRKKTGLLSLSFLLCLRLNLLSRLASIATCFDEVLNHLVIFHQFIQSLLIFKKYFKLVQYFVLNNTVTFYIGYDWAFKYQDVFQFDTVRWEEH
jgi:hypothetical protein